MQDPQQRIQEDRYSFPYHYLPMWNGKKFTQTRALRWGYEYLSYLTFVADKAEEIGYSTLLDVGCGDGRLLHELRVRDSSRRLVGVDFSQRAIHLARAMEPDVEWIHGNVTEECLSGPGGVAGFPDHGFDVVTLVETLEHIPLPEVPSFVGSVRQLVSKEGRLLVTVPSKNVPLHKKHYQHFDSESLVKALHPFFDIVELKYLNRQANGYLRLWERCLSNRYFMLNHRRLLNGFYRGYLDKFLHASQNDCRRLAAVCRPAAHASQIPRALDEPLEGQRDH